MATALRVLMLEDTPSDARLVQHELRRAGFELDAVVVDNEADFVAQLRPELDLILADFNLPQFDALRALELFNRRGLEVPFIIVSGTIGEEAAAECIKRGAADYLLKDRLARLGPAVAHALETRNLLREKRQLELQFHTAQRMDAIGRLAGGVAHDFNNILSVVTGYCNILMRKIPRQDPLFGPVEQINKAGERAVTLTRQLLAFSRKQLTSPKVFDLSALVGDMEKMLLRLIGEDVLLQIRPDADPCPVHADTGQIEQVVMNLVVNARDAMPEGGRLAIDTAGVDLDEDALGGRPRVKPGPYVLLAVADSGIGMDQEIQEHIFEPFYTTKDPEQGTGLGLATVYGIVKQSEGYINVRSAPGEGTTFEIFLPQAAAAQPPQPPRAARPLPPGEETILFVEDDESVRKLYSAALHENGYRVIEACHGGEALQLARSFAGVIDLLVTDIVMPYLNGLQLAERLAPARPAMKVLYISGFAAKVAALARGGRLDPESNYLQKPFTPDELGCRIRRLLGVG